MQAGARAPFKTGAQFDAEATCLDRADHACRGPEFDAPALDDGAFQGSFHDEMACSDSRVDLGGGSDEQEGIRVDFAFEPAVDASTGGEMNSSGEDDVRSDLVAKARFAWRAGLVSRLRCGPVARCAVRCVLAHRGPTVLSSHDPFGVSRGGAL